MRESDRSRKRLSRRVFKFALECAPSGEWPAGEVFSDGAGVLGAGALGGEMVEEDEIVEEDEAAEEEEAADDDEADEDDEAVEDDEVDEDDGEIAGEGSTAGGRTVLSAETGLGCSLRAIATAARMPGNAMHN